MASITVPGIEVVNTPAQVRPSSPVNNHLRTRLSDKLDLQAGQIQTIRPSRNTIVCLPCPPIV